MPIISALISLQSANWKVRFSHLGDWLSTHEPTKWSLEALMWHVYMYKDPTIGVLMSVVHMLAFVLWPKPNRFGCIGGFNTSTSIQFPPCSPSCTSTLHKDQIPIWSSFPARTIKMIDPFALKQSTWFSNWLPQSWLTNGSYLVQKMSQMWQCEVLAIRISTVTCEYLNCYCIPILY